MAPMLSSVMLATSLTTCLAYVGPGPGLSMLGAILGLLFTLFLCFSAIALWPIRALIRRWRGDSATEAAGECRS